jgi:hypothetical protein
MIYNHIDTAQRIDFDRLDMLVSERIGVLKLYVQNIDKAVEDKSVHDALCRDLIMPCIGLLAQFVESVTINSPEPGA